MSHILNQQASARWNAALLWAPRNTWATPTMDLGTARRSTATEMRGSSSAGQWNRKWSKDSGASRHKGHVSLASAPPTRA